MPARNQNSASALLLGNDFAQQPASNKTFQVKRLVEFAIARSAGARAGILLGWGGRGLPGGDGSPGASVHGVGPEARHTNHNQASVRGPRPLEVGWLRPALGTQVRLFTRHVTPRPMRRAAKL